MLHLQPACLNRLIYAYKKKTLNNKEFAGDVFLIRLTTTSSMLSSIVIQIFLIGVLAKDVFTFDISVSR